MQTSYDELRSRFPSRRIPTFIFYQKTNKISDIMDRVRHEKLLDWFDFTGSAEGI